MLWGKPECREFLDHLLHENRDGRRGGFSLAAYEDILFLRHLADTLGADSDAARRKRAQAAAAPGPAARMPPPAPKRQPTLDLELALDEDMLESGQESVRRAAGEVVTAGHGRISRPARPSRGAPPGAPSRPPSGRASP